MSSNKNIFSSPVIIHLVLLTILHGGFGVRQCFHNLSEVNSTFYTAAIGVIPPHQLDNDEFMQTYAEANAQVLNELLQTPRINYCQLAMNLCELLPENMFQSVTTHTAILHPQPTNSFDVYYPMKYPPYTANTTKTAIRRILSFTRGIRCTVNLGDNATTDFLITTANYSTAQLYILTSPEEEGNFVLTTEIIDIRGIAGNGHVINGI